MPSHRASGRIRPDQRDKKIQNCPCNEEEEKRGKKRRSVCLSVALSQLGVKSTRRRMERRRCSTGICLRHSRDLLLFLFHLLQLGVESLRSFLLFCGTRQDSVAAQFEARHSLESNAFEILLLFLADCVAWSGKRFVLVTAWM
jgi:hypothetical protein